MLTINSKNLHFSVLNEQIHQALATGEKELTLDNVNGQRYIGDGIKDNSLKININGIPGNDLGAFMDGPTIITSTNGQDVIGNTMNGGKIIINGNAGDIVGHAMRGGDIFVKGNVGYRVGIHMKSYKNLNPVIVAGGNAGDFLGEYMAGGLIIVMGTCGDFIGTGMHGGTIFIYGSIENHQLGKEVGILPLDESDHRLLSNYLIEYNTYFNVYKHIDTEINYKQFKKLVPVSSRPYGRLYAY
jgi:glutamate synthase domain-containing protein 3